MEAKEKQINNERERESARRVATVISLKGKLLLLLSSPSSFVITGIDARHRRCLLCCHQFFNVRERARKI
jgi:hypothetical protein